MQKSKDEKSRGEEILEKIKDGSIIEDLRLHSNLRLKPTGKRIADCVIEFHKEKYIMPRKKDICDSTGLSLNVVRGNCRDLSEREILCPLTFLEIFNVFGYYENFQPKILDSLYEATQRELDGLRGSRSFAKMTGYPTANYFTRFYLDLSAEEDDSGNKVPSFKGIFDFLPQYRQKS